MFPITTVIYFCTNEIRFIKPCLEAIEHISSEILIVVWDRFFDGTLEDEEALFFCFERFPKVRFFLSPHIPCRVPKKLQRKIGKDFWQNCASMIGAHFATQDYVFFLDVDEIVDASSFSSWLQTGKYKEYDALRLANFWYFRTPEMQATSWEDSAVLARKGNWQIKALHCPGIRHAIYDRAEKKVRHVVGLDGQPMIHHYSWVRTKEEVLKKMRSSNHRNENDWEKLIEEEWSHPPSTKDFVHGYELKKVAPFVPIDLSLCSSMQHGKESISQKPLPPNVVRLSSDEFLKIIGVPFWHRMLTSLKSAPEKQAIFQRNF
jgi:hypothetical protein